MKRNFDNNTLSISKMTEFVPPQIRTVLKTYQNSATKSLQGPGQTLTAAAAAQLVAAHQQAGNSPPTIVKKEYLNSPEPLDFDKNDNIPPPPELPQPILTQSDSGRGELYETTLEGKPIGCFLLGGEMRLCLPQFLNNVLTDFTLDQINRIFDDLQIFCSQCTPEQLMEFKNAKILPEDVKASGLITRTDAERLCSALLHRSDHLRCNIDIPKGAISFKVYHRCFGKCEGICAPDLLTFENPACIMCLECKGMFSPQKFVGHVHRQQENRTCHWGFDSRNWRDYLHVGLDVENRDKFTKMLDELRDVELELLNAQRDIATLKRKAELLEDSSISPPMAQTCKRDIDIQSSKKQKIIDDSAYLLEYQRYQHAALFYAHCAQQREQMSAFRPWAPKPPLLHLPFAAAAAALPYLSQEPPVLQNPERVVRNTESERFERTYQPNVALAPRKSILSKEREKEQQQRNTSTAAATSSSGGSSTERNSISYERNTNSFQSQINPTTLNESAADMIQIIKKERPQSPEVQSPEETRLPSLPPSSSTTSSSSLINSNTQQSNNRHRHLDSKSSPSITTALSSEEFSGSNEITSSTSPIPANQHNGLSEKSCSLESDQHRQATKANNDQILRTTSSSSTIKQESRIHISQNLLSNPNIIRSPTPPVEQYTNNKQKIRMSSDTTTSGVGNNSTTVLVKNFANGHRHHHHHSSEFELSTDTDDDSSGEPDSSNLLLSPSPWDIAADALKDTQPSDRERVLQILKFLLTENAQLRQAHVERLQELQQRNDQINDMQRELHNLQRQVSLLTSPTTGTQQQQQQKASMTTQQQSHSVIAKVENCQQQKDTKVLNGCYDEKLDTKSTIVSLYQKSENDSKIKVLPLKKSLRRSPDDSIVVVLNSTSTTPTTTAQQNISSTGSNMLPNNINKTTNRALSPDSAEYYELINKNKSHQQQTSSSICNSN